MNKSPVRTGMDNRNSVFRNKNTNECKFLLKVHIKIVLVFFNTTPEEGWEWLGELPCLAMMALGWIPGIPGDVTPCLQELFIY